LEKSTKVRPLFPGSRHKKHVNPRLPKCSFVNFDSDRFPIQTSSFSVSSLREVISFPSLPHAVPLRNCFGVFGCSAFLYPLFPHLFSVPCTLRDFSLFRRAYPRPPSPSISFPPFGRQCFPPFFLGIHARRPVSSLRKGEDAVLLSFFPVAHQTPFLF